MPSITWTDDGQDKTQQAGDYAVAEVTRFFSRGLERCEVTYAAENTVTYGTTTAVEDLTGGTILEDGRTVTGIAMELNLRYDRDHYPLYDVRVDLEGSDHPLCLPKGTTLQCSELVFWDVLEITHFYLIDPVTGDPIDGPSETYYYDHVGDFVLHTQAEAEALMNRTAADISASVLT